MMARLRAMLPQAIVAIALAFGLPCVAVAQAHKLDAPLVLFSTNPGVALKAFADRVDGDVSKLKSASDARLPLMIRLVDGIDPDVAIAQLREAGAEVRSRLGPVVTAQASASSLKALAALDAVMMIELSRPARSRLNVSVPATGAASLRSGAAPNWTGLTGKGVIVGVIDDGVDFRHRDFRKADGTTRLLSLWDQRDTGAAGAPPAGYTYGGECTPAMINAAINGDMTACTQPSTGGHGTHVAGIAAGNGGATGAAQPAYRFVGMAPEADIIAANTLGAAKGSTGLLDAVAWMKATAAAAGKPLVINMSLGSYYGARDGTSAYEQGLSAAVGPGVIIVGAAGNEGASPIRGEAPISQGGQVVVEVEASDTARNETFEVWYPGTDEYSLSIKPPTCPETTVVLAADAGNFDTPCGLILVINAGPFPTNDDRQLRVVLLAGASPVAAGIWRFTVTGAKVAQPSTPVSFVTGEVAGPFMISTINGQKPTRPTTKIITDTASAKRVIAVGAYNTNYSWVDKAGFPTEFPPTAGAIDDLAIFSSRGPRRMCSNAAKCPAQMKPDIIAPGSFIMSSLASDNSQSSSVTERDGVHVALQGTSMATPHVSGAIALMLQKRATLTPEEVRQLLFTNIRKTTFTPAVPAYTGTDQPANPNYDWGYGVLDVAKAANAISANPAAVVTAFEFLYQPENRYFLTIDAGEANAIDNGAAGPGWQRTGFTFKAYATAGDAPTGAVPVCRFYGSVSPGPNSHFFTASTAECQALKDQQATTPATQKRWNYEGIAFRIAEPDAARNCSTGLTQVYRAYNNGFTRGIDSNHRFSTSTAEIQKMVTQGWANEGAVFCSPQ